MPVVCYWQTITNVFDDILDFQRQTVIFPLLLYSVLLKSLYSKGLWERCEEGQPCEIPACSLFPASVIPSEPTEGTVKNVLSLVNAHHC